MKPSRRHLVSVPLLGTSSAALPTCAEHCLFQAVAHDVRAGRRPCRGMAVIMVLLLLSLTLGLCYAAMRGQYAGAIVGRNFGRRASARQAALTGMMMALKKMHRSDWGGVGTSISGATGTYETFLVPFTAGDSTLSTTDSNQPYRVTLLSKGYAVDSEHPQSIATYQITAIVRFIPRRLAAEPSDWTAMAGYTFYQTHQDTTSVDIPCRITGLVRLQKNLRIAPDYPNTSDSRTRYLADLNAMRQAGLSDYRPFNGPVYLPVSAQESTYYPLLTSSLGVTAVNVTATEVATNWSQPTSLATYRIYPGGPSYTIQTVSSSLGSTALGPDAQINPLGLFYYNGSMTLGNNVTIQGSLFCAGNLQITGTSVVVQPVALPSLAGSASTTIRLAAASCGNATVAAGSGTQITGLLAVFGEFKIAEDAAATTFALAGQLVAKKLTIEKCKSWNNLNWSWYYTLFTYQLSNATSPVKYFPVWMSSWGFDPTPKLTFAQESSAVTYHWAASYDSIYVAHPSDAGLRWDLLSWSESQ